MKIAVATVQVPFVRGGSEVLAEGLCAALRAAGHEVELIALPFAPHTTEGLLDSLAAFRLIELGPEFDQVIALKFPAYLIRHPVKVLWLVHQHHGAYERFGGDFGLGNLPDGRLAREAVVAADHLALREAVRIFAISRTVAARLAASHGLEASVLLPPPRQSFGFYCAAEAARPYLFFPSRLAPAKRQLLALAALARTREPVRLVFAGAPDHPAYGEELVQQAAALGVAERVEWRGFVPDGELRDLYAACRAVLFPPLDEDYGYVSLEAMLSGKAVITCEDSGGTLEFVEVGATGWITAPEPAALAAALDDAWRDPQRARSWGAAAKAAVSRRGIGWRETLEGLVGAAAG